MKYLLLFFLASCGEPPHPVVSFIWDYYGANSQPPDIVWHIGTCDWQHRYGISYDGKCYHGLYFPDTETIHVEWRGRFSDTALAHELMHAYQYQDLGILDYQHDRPEWYTEILVLEAMKERGW